MARRGMTYGDFAGAILRAIDRSMGGRDAIPESND